MPPPLHRVI